MGKKLAIKGHSIRGKEVIELLEMMGGKNNYKVDGANINCTYIIRHFDHSIIGGWSSSTEIVFTLEEFLEVYPFKVGDKVFLYDNITEGCVTGMKWDEDKGTVKYCVYTSAEYWCDVKELLKWNAEFLVNKEKGEEVDKMLRDITLSHLHRNHLEDVLSELYEHIKTTSKEELEREYEEIKEWSDVGPTVEEFITFCECVNKKPKYPTTYEECYDEGNTELHFIYVDKDERDLYESFIQLIRCRNAYWKIAGEEMGLNKLWEPDWKSGEQYKYCIYYADGNIQKGTWFIDSFILAFPSEEMRDIFCENFKKEIEQCKELL